MSRERAAQAHSADIRRRVQRKEEEPVKSESSALNIAGMSSPQKLEAALQHTLPLLPAEVRTKVEALLSPEALATIAAVAGLWAASHAVGVGEIIDLVLLGLGALALGAEAFTVGQDIGGFVSTALQAQEEQDLDRAAEHLARAVATVGVDTVLALLTHKVGGAAKDRLPGQPEMVTPEGMRVRVPESEQLVSKPLAIEAKQEGSSAEAIKQRMRELNAQGHGPARHGPHLTEKQLEDRVLKGYDPVTGTTDDAYKKFLDGTPMKHGYGKHATKVISEEGYVKAEKYLRSTQRFKDLTMEADMANNTITKAVEVPLEEIYGQNYKKEVFGKTRQGSAKHPTGVTEADFTDGIMKAYYKKDTSGDWKLHTMYPEPK
ncbi:hypothetical protein [Anthocerotibacter panamensis]|uniref:hypothetical protein n=1 Tax=Anthocerotibacter panamensis TaxID=2857077 RepID=UPI001C406E91|nr:hypothetical protein [Anthocerotibacter panamensis]